MLVLAGSSPPPSSSLPPTPPRIVRMDLSVPEDERTLDLFSVSGSANTSQRGNASNQTSRPDPTSIHKLFLDPSGRHIIVSTLSGDNYYFFSGWDTHVKRARALVKLKGIIINAVSWNSPLEQSSSQVASTTMSTKEILLGDTNGHIYEAVLDASAGGDVDVPVATALRNFGRGGNLERHAKLVYTLNDNDNSRSGSGEEIAESHAITGIRSEIWSGIAGSQQKRRAVVFVTTSSRIYQFVGSVPANAANVSVAERDEGGMYDDLFRLYRDMTPSRPSTFSNLISKLNSFLYRIARIAWQCNVERAALLASDNRHGLIAAEYCRLAHRYSIPLST